MFGMKRFYDYLVGHHFLLYTDHKPLLALLNEHHATSPQASARIHRGPCFSLHMRTTSNSETLSLMLMLMP